MNWPVFLIAAYLTLVLESGLDALLRVGEVVPSLTLILAVHVAWSGSRSSVPWAMLLLGFGQDMTHPLKVWQGEDLPLLGPGCLGYLAAGYVCLHLRAQLRRASPVAFALMTLAAGVFLHLVVVVLITARGLPFPTGEPPEGWVAADELVARFLTLVYTVVLAAPLGMAWERTTPLWRFVSGNHTAARAHRLD